LRPVSLGVAKDQHLSLNPSQISGACGRLMCCLRYEHDFYVQSRKRFPKEGRILVTAIGEEKVLANDIFNDRVTLRGPEGDTRVVSLADLRRELDSVSEAGSGALAPPTDDSDHPGESIDEVVATAITALPVVPASAMVIEQLASEDATVPGSESSSSEAEAPEEQRARRRRGRRGGRRGRKPGERGPSSSEG
jgi:hypothetical protein